MIKTIKNIISVCAVTSLLALSFIGCSININTPETKYKVTFDNNGHGTKPDAIEVKENTVLALDQLKPLTADDYTFDGWFDGDKEAIAGSYKVTKNVTLKAMWSEWGKVTDVTFSKTGLVDFQDEVTLNSATDGATIHYTVGNETEKTAVNSVKIKITDNVTVKAYATKNGMTTSNTTNASYTIITYTVSYDTKGIVATQESSIGWKGKVVPLPSYDIKGFYFDGWYNGETKIENDKVKIGTTDIKLTAKWIPHIILADGKTVRYDQITPAQKGNAIAVACGVNSQGKLLGLGLKQSKSALQWAKIDTIGYNKYFTDLVCTPSEDFSSGSADRAIFTGDKDGSDNWGVILNEYKKNNKSEADALSDCPIFNWVNNYGKDGGPLAETTYQDGWYIPSIAEMAVISKNINSVNSALKDVGGTTIEGNYYWSSSLYKSCHDIVRVISFWDGFLNYYPKDRKFNVCCIRTF